MWRRLLGWNRSDEPMPEAQREHPEALLRRVESRVLRPLAQQLGGDEHSRYRGPGVQLDELREYQPGDDVRRIDWNVTARAQQPYVREAYVERALDVWLLVDVSASVDWGTAECLKRDRALELAAVAGRLLGRNGNRVGAVWFAERPLAFVAPCRGVTHARRPGQALLYNSGNLGLSGCRRVAAGAATTGTAPRSDRRASRGPA